MLYNQLFTMVRPFFISRWGWALSNNDMLEQYINVSIQDIYSFHDWIFKIKEEDLVSEENWDYLKWNLTTPIDRPIEIWDQNWTQLHATTWSIWEQDKDANVKIWHDFLLTRADVDITAINIRYYTQYEWIEFNANWTDPLPFPNKFVPALINKIYDLASPISYFEDDNVVPRYQIAVRQLNELKQYDSISADTYFMPDKAY